MFQASPISPNGNTAETIPSISNQAMEISESESASPVYSPQAPVPRVSFPDSKPPKYSDLGNICGNTPPKYSDLGNVCENTGSEGDMINSSCGVVNPLFELDIIRSPLEHCLRSSQGEDDDQSLRLPGRPVQLSLRTQSPRSNKFHEDRLPHGSEESLNGNSCYTCKSTEQASDVCS